MALSDICDAATATATTAGGGCGDVGGACAVATAAAANNQEGVPDDDECELTNLNWLTELKNVGYIQLAEGPVPDVPLTRFNKFLDELKIDQEKYKQDESFYKSNGDEKPPFNYAHLIGVSLLENGRMTLQQVYDWIQENFAYYKCCGTNWQSSIRHNLSLGYFFKNTARGDNERGKGGYWELALDSRKTEWKRNRKSRKNKLIGQFKLDREHNNSHRSQHSGSGGGGGGGGFDVGGVGSLKKNPLKSINGYASGKTKQQRLASNGKPERVKGKLKRHANGRGVPDSCQTIYKDENRNEHFLTHSPTINNNTTTTTTAATPIPPPTELILTVEAQSDEYYGRITEHTPVEFADDFNFNNQIFQASEVPQPVDDVEVPFFTSPTANSPNVIVEPLPYHLPPLDDYNFATSFNEQKIFEDLLEYENELM